MRRNGSRIAFPGNKRHAARATKQVFKLARLSPRVRRVYFYHWQPADVRLPSWDSALVDPRGKPRPAYKVLRSWIRKLARAARGATRGGAPRRTPEGGATPEGGTGPSAAKAEPVRWLPVAALAAAGALAGCSSARRIIAAAAARSSATR